MQKSEYIRFNNTLIRNDFRSVLLYFNFFHEYIVNYRILPFFLKGSYNFIKKWLLVIFLFVKHGLLRLKLEVHDENFVIRRVSGINMKNDISLIDDSGKFLIKRVIYTEAAYTSYKDYYLKYRGNKSKLHLPESYFDDQTRTVLTEFVAEPKLINLFYNCHYGYRGVVKIFKEICPQIDLMHERDEEGLVHGDFSVANVLVDKDNNCYWIIDYFDSFSYEKEYDKYLLIRSILKFFGINVDLHNIQKYLPLNKQKIDEYERIYWLKRAIKRS